MQINMNVHFLEKYYKNFIFIIYMCEVIIAVYTYYFLMTFSSIQIL